MKQQDLTQGGIVQNIFRFALPYMFAYFLQILYGLADMFVIGQYCKVDSITAVSNGAQVYICFAGIPFIMAYNVIASIYRGLGDTQTPLYFVIIACVTNILLDYLFIGYCGLGPMGATLGTTLSQSILQQMFETSFYLRIR